MKKMKNMLYATIVVGIALAFIMPGAAISDTRIYNKKVSSTTSTLVSESPIQLTGTVLFEDDFESYDDFVLDFPPWTQYDGDELPTWGFQNYNFPNMGYIGSFIIFVPSQCTPPLDDPPHSGEKYAACFDGAEDPPLNSNDDWMITPQLSTSVGDLYVAIHCVDWDAFWLGIDDFNVTDTGESIEISFWAKTGSSLYEPDRFQVGVSTTDNDPESFYIISPEPYVEPPAMWTQYIYEWTEVPEEPELEIGEITGGLFTIKSSIKNIGNGEATDVNWSITLDGGLIILGKNTAGTIASIPAEDEALIKSDLILGIGKTTITVSVGAEEKTIERNASGFVFLFFVLGVQ